MVVAGWWLPILLIPALGRQRDRDRRIFEFKASLVYKVSSRTSRAIQRNLASKNERERDRERGRERERERERERRERERENKTLLLPNPTGLCSVSLSRKG